MSATELVPPTAEMWPPFGGPSDLGAIERVSLSGRGLPVHTYELVRRAAELWPDRPAISILPDAERFRTPFVRTFGELADDVQRAAAVLSALGVRRGRAVSVMSVNCAEMLPLLLAAEAVGIYAPINPGLAVEHAVELVRLSGSRVIVAAGPELDPTVWAHARTIAAETDARALLALRPTAARDEPPPLEPLHDGIEVAYLAERVAEVETLGLPGVAPDPHEFASYLHTGGTTGIPKLAARTHANELANAWMIASRDTLDRDSVLFAGLPLFHTNALLVTLLAPLLKGQHVVWAGQLGYRDPSLYANFWKIVEHYGIAAMSGVPTVYSMLAEVPVNADISSLRLPIVGAAPLPPAVARAFEERTGVRLCEGYGLTEGTCASAFGWPDAPRAETVGQRLPYQEVRAVDIDEGTGEWTFLPENEVGTLVLRGPNIFAGYLTRGRSGPTLCADGKLTDGWLDTGDLGSVDADGFIRLAGRAKDLIIRGGHNIDPATVEDALLEHPDVTAAAAVGRPDPHSGEVPVAFVTLASGTGRTSGELEAWAADHVPERAAAPKHVEIVDAIPVTAVGKQFKPELRRRAAEERRATLSPGRASVNERVRFSSTALSRFTFPTQTTTTRFVRRSRTSPGRGGSQAKRTDKETPMATLVTADAVQHPNIEQTRWRIDPARSRVAFRARTYWGLMTVNGEFERSTGTLDLEAQPAIELTIDAASLNTQNKLRDRHLRSADFFDVTRHPDVRFTSETASLDGEQLKVRGQLEAAGNSITLELSALVRRVGDELESDATTHVDHEQLGMSWSKLGLIPTPTELIVHGRLVR